jgi:hypothetical protein
LTKRLVTVHGAQENGTRNECKFSYF